MSCGGSGGGGGVGGIRGAKTSIGAVVVESVAAGRDGGPFAPADSGGFALGALPASPRHGTGGVTIGL